jgi:hypothetical protein
MEALNGTALDKLPYKGLFKVSDLLYYEGPLLSHFRDSNDNHFFFYWVDVNEVYNRWLSTFPLNCVLACKQR